MRRKLKSWSELRSKENTSPHFFNIKVLQPKKKEPGESNLEKKNNIRQHASPRL